MVHLIISSVKMSSIKARYIKAGFGFVLALFISISSGGLSALQMAPPEYKTLDRNGVNVAAGAVAKTVPTVSIGGSTGLSHSVSVYSNMLLGKNPGGAPLGFTDKYGGNIRYTQVVGNLAPFANPENWRNYYPGGVWVMRVHDHDGSADFKIMSGGYAQGYTPNLSSNYSYEALRDKRHTLEVAPGAAGYLLWTKPDGTEVLYYRGVNAKASSKGHVKKVTYPNGFEIYYDGFDSETPASVSTNTGFKLIYNYVAVNGPNDAPGSGGVIPARDSSNWAANNAASVLGINMAVERCTGSVCVGAQASCPTNLINGQTCHKLTKEWPMATFEWPLGMPQTPYNVPTIVKVTDEANRTTEFHTEPKTVYLALLTSSKEPRLVKIKSPSASAAETLLYYNIQNNHPYGTGAPNAALGKGYLNEVWSPLGTTTYTDSMSGASENSAHKSRNSTYYYIENRGDIFGALVKVKNNIDGSTVVLEDYVRNVPISSQPAEGPTEDYEYLGNNMTKKIFNKGKASESAITAEYNVACTSTTRKICNSATSITDARGYKTEYAYDALHGQLLSETKPADQNGVKAQTRYTYDQYQARYMNQSGQFIQGSPIWLKETEAYCINSNYVNNTCTGNDEVVTEYFYNSDNLFLTSMVVTGQRSGESRTTCYEYDRYGNKIGETQPKGGCQ